MPSHVGGPHLDSALTRVAAWKERAEGTRGKQRRGLSPHTPPSGRRLRKPRRYGRGSPRRATLGTVCESQICICREMGRGRDPLVSESCFARDDPPLTAQHICSQRPPKMNQVSVENIKCDALAAPVLCRSVPGGRRTADTWCHARLFLVEISGVSPNKRPPQSTRPSCSRVS